MRTADFEYDLPESLIATRPAPTRDQSRLLVLDRARSRWAHQPCFRDLLTYLRSGDLLVLNDSRVLHARLRGQKAGTNGQIELLLLEETSTNSWWTLLRPGKRVRVGTRIIINDAVGASPLEAIVKEKNAEGHYLVSFSVTGDIKASLERIGEIPLPPYIARKPEDFDRERYQTVFSRVTGSVAAPTAGLHFTESLLREIQDAGVEIGYITLHVGLGTFAPVKETQLEKHPMHEERFVLGDETARAVNSARLQRRRVLAVGTTTVRVLESVATSHSGKIVATEGRTGIFIYPPFRFQIVDGLLTNFHLPRSTLLMLVSAFAAPGETRGRDLVLAAYADAVRAGYRFFSYGDAMLLV
jgi:S-adenosylmethionine:tRNA ribosyltransferase-isomerase